VLQVSALVIAGNSQENDLVAFKDASGKSVPMSKMLALLLIMASLPLFVVFLRRLARILERPALERRARSILILLALAGIALTIALLGAFVYRLLVPGTHMSHRFLLPPIFMIPLLIALVLAFVVELKCCGLIRDMQSAIMQRL